MILQRRAIRAILLTGDHADLDVPADRTDGLDDADDSDHPAHEAPAVLLLRIRPPEGGDAFWITPGGGLEAGESPEAGLRRELREELGLEEFLIGPLVWRRQHTFNWAGKRICQREDYHVVHVAPFEPRMSDPVEAGTLERFHWWPVRELASTRDRLTPLSLAEIVARYLAQGPPVEAPEIEVLVD